MRGRWLAALGVVLGGLIVVAVALVAIARPTQAPPSNESAARSSESPVQSGASPAPSEHAGPDARIPFTDPTSPEDAAWYRVGGDPGQFPPHLQVGTIDVGVTFDVELRFDPQVGPNAIVPQRPVMGVGGGVVVMVDDDGARSTVRAIVAASGAVHDLAVTDDVIVTGVLAPDGRVAYYVTADRLTGDLIGVWRLAVVGGGPPESLEALVASPPAIRLAAITHFLTDVLLSPDGSTLALFRCVDVNCVLRAVRTHDGSLVGEAAIPRGGGTPFAITDRWGLLRPSVPDGPFRIGEIVDLATGAIEPMPFEGWPSASEAVVESAEGPVLVLQTAGFTAPPPAIGQPPMQPAVTVITIGEMRAIDEFAPPLGSLQVHAPDDVSVGVDLPAGWLLVGGSEPEAVRMGAYALSLADGSLVPLPAVGEFFTQG